MGYLESFREGGKGRVLYDGEVDLIKQEVYIFTRIFYFYDKLFNTLSS